MRRASSSLLALLLAACASGASGPGGTGSSGASRSPGPGAARLASVAEREWRAWGRIAVDGWPVALERTPDATPELFERLMTYWSATPEGPEVVTAHRLFRDTITAPLAEAASLDPVSGLPFTVVPANVAISSFNHPAWSAAFISFAMAEAGAPRADFDPSASHALYVDRLIAAALADPEGAAFLPRGPAEHAARPGDLLCADRSAAPLPDWPSRLAEAGSFRPMHCDIVVRAGGGTVDIIGGNVLDVVLRRRVPTDAAGHVLPPPPDRPPFFVIFENRR
ncbi:DUF2272 domain-containing protein [Muricoccus pecuniae]|uniref:DUF2272 domain-containing protein n=1 Tax=Muricoccus pecuniae TaxID=693023 RepID=A0A840XZE5_9PROT|nr:DUF2272 domain-containing protein [Roseomonas pecuniae]MBB5692670.1 hypothetical protein [Roseomonas pecuniae]